MDMDAQQLLKKIGEGDEKAFADFYTLYENRLYRFIKSKLNDSFEASDILHETFMEVWRKAGKFEGRSKVSTWLFSIAYFKTVDKLRKKTPIPVSDEDMPEIADENPDAMACLLSQEKNRHVAFCLETLKAAHRAVMQLAFFEELSYSEIAKIEDCPENTVKTRMFHAKQAMKHCLAGRMGEKA
ncbi:RNA polymerase sigma factor [Curvivirga aplysinae]|uniref:RNA polymerase sigma factor n=1 Tax=Curvivirga aplysinae TaxID=2529852 RepID=UPI0012BBF3E9|nr:sigma-70 family RNA polymerase sigma factor [Curvivirga aplysinae]MTI08987.1 sigma-70 family RNA polymerase sigma factor [Curvivirga aplysinae]